MSAAAQISDFAGKRVSVVLCDGRHYVGELVSADIHLNLMLKSCEERLYSADAPPHVLETGAVMIRGAKVAAVALVDTLAEAELVVDDLRLATVAAER